MVPFIVPQSRIGRNGIKASAWQPLALVEVAWQPNVKTALQRPKELSLWQPWRTLTIEPRKTAMSLFLSEFLYHALRREQENRPLFEFVTNALSWFDERDDQFVNFHRKAAISTYRPRPSHACARTIYIILSPRSLHSSPSSCVWTYGRCAPWGLTTPCAIGRWKLSQSSTACTSPSFQKAAA